MKKWFIVILLSAALIGCQPKEVIFSAPGQQLPEIAYRENPYGKDDLLGFINPNGSNHVSLAIDLYSPFLVNLWKAYQPTLSRARVTWSPDGNYLAGRYQRYIPDAGSPMLISIQGEILKCPENKNVFDGPGALWVLSDTTLLTIAGGLESGVDRVVLVEMETCREVDELYSAENQEQTLVEATLSSQNWLAVRRNIGSGPSFRSEILILDSAYRQQAIILGERSAWSSDGEWLAYDKYPEGIYIVRKDGSGVRKIVEHPSASCPSWSPNNEWLAYSRITPQKDHGIYRINLETGEEIELFSPGSCPSWRQTPTTH